MAEESIYGDAVERSIDAGGNDLFDEVFGEDNEKKAAKEKLKAHAEELKKAKDKMETKNENNKKTQNDDKEDKEDDDEEIEGEEGSTEPELFGEVEDEEEMKKKAKEINEEEDEDVKEEKENKKAKSTPNRYVPKDEDKKEDNFQTMEDTLTSQDDGSIPKSNSDFDEVIKKGLEKSLNANGKENESSQKKNLSGKLNLKVTMDEETEEEDIGISNPIEKNIIKTIIKNKAMKAAKDEPKKEETKGEHDEMAESLLREEGTIDEDTIKQIDTDIINLQKEAESDNENSDTTEESTDPSIVKPRLEFLMSQNGHAYIGRKKSVLGKYGEEAGLFVGRVKEKELPETDVYLDGLNPHVVFVCGARGSGKSYVLGVIAEEMALKNKNVGIVVVDPIGVFWSMKHPNKEEKELEILTNWGMMPRGLDNIKVFIPVGMKESAPKSTFDAVFSIQPALLTAEDWCLTFGIDRFSPTGLLMEKGIAKAKSGYVTIEGKPVRGKENTFSLEDLIKCFEFDSELNDRDKGYKSDSIRALISRFDAAKHWGIFDEKGTPLSQLSKAGQMTILDTSFLEDNVSALVIGIFARRLLSARKLSTRREAAGKFAENELEDLVELNVPPTWLFIDEAHTLIPGGNQKTPASSALVEYVKQGRRPGCSLVFATQQPSAIDSRVLSQLDVIMAHKLVFDDDIKAIYKRTPAIIPYQYKKPNFIKTMPVGIALTGDRQETTSRAFVMSIRPRMSQHEGRDAETTENKQELPQDQVENLAVNITMRQLSKDPKIAIETLEQTLETLNGTYKKNVQLKTIIEMLEKKKIRAEENYLWAPGVKEEEEEQNEIELEEEDQETPMNKTPKTRTPLEDESEFEGGIDLIALQSKIEENEARKLLANYRLKKVLGLLGEEEILDRLSQKYGLIYKVKYNYFTQKDAYHIGEAYIDAITNEFIHDANGKIVESKGLEIINKLSESEATAFGLLIQKRTLKDIAKRMNMEEGNAKRILDELIKKKIVSTFKIGEETVFQLTTKPDLPPSPLHAILPSIGKRPITEVEGISVVPPALQEREVPELLKKLWGNITVKEIRHLFLPVWEGVLKKKTGEERTIIIDAINGKQMKY